MSEVDGLIALIKENAAYLASGEYPLSIIRIITFDTETSCIASLIIPVSNNKADGRRLLCKGHSYVHSPRKHVEALEDLLNEVKAVVRNNAKWEFGEEIEDVEGGNGALGGTGGGLHAQ